MPNNIICSKCSTPFIVDSKTKALSCGDVFCTLCIADMLAQDDPKCCICSVAIDQANIKPVYMSYEEDIDHHELRLAVETNPSVRALEEELALCQRKMIVIDGIETALEVEHRANSETADAVKAEIVSIRKTNDISKKVLSRALLNLEAAKKGVVDTEVMIKDAELEAEKLRREGAV